MAFDNAEKYSKPVVVMVSNLVLLSKLEEINEIRPASINMLSLRCSVDLEAMLFKSMASDTLSKWLRATPRESLHKSSTALTQAL